MTWWLLALVGLVTSLVGRAGENRLHGAFSYRPALNAVINLAGMLFGLLHLLGTLALVAAIVLGMADASGAAILQWAWPW